MLRLTTFGGVQLREDGAPHVGAASQRRRLALLVLVAAAGDSPITREKLVSLLWADADTERARHALRQALHALQQVGGPDGMLLGSTALQLNPAVITSDLAEFVAAAEAGVHERVVALHRGPFLDGFFVGEAPEFERWVDAQRAHYTTTYTSALEALARKAESRGDRAGAVSWWRRLATEQPVSARFALGYMRALAEAGDRTGAIQFATVHETVVRQELGIEPDASVVEYATRLRAGEIESRPGPSEGSVAAGLRQHSARSRMRERQIAWLDRTLGARFDIDTQTPAPASGGVAGYRAYDRVRREPVEIELLDAGVSVVADLDLLRSSLDHIATLSEPHIARLREHGAVDGVVYYIVDRPDGVSLRDHLARERQLPVDEAVSIARGTALALAHAHSHDVLHGDLRPKYVVVAADGCRLTGLGIAEAITRATAHDRTSTALRMGSPAYQSPELLSGEPRLDARADVYSFGCMLYEMLAGEVPFASASATNMVGAKLTSPAPSLRDRRDSVSPALDAVIQRCLARVPSDRYRNGGEVARALEALG